MPKVRKDEVNPNGTSKYQGDEKWRVSTRILRNPNDQFVVLEYQGKGSERNFRVDLEGGGSTSYKAGGRWKYICVSPLHAPFLMKPRVGRGGMNLPSMFKLASNDVANKIQEYVKNRAQEQAQRKSNIKNNIPVTNNMVNDMANQLMIDSVGATTKVSVPEEPIEVQKPVDEPETAVLDDPVQLEEDTPKRGRPKKSDS